MIQTTTYDFMEKCSLTLSILWKNVDDENYHYNIISGFIDANLG